MIRNWETLWILRYASLLHDIGKFSQRCAGRPFFPKHPETGCNFILQSAFPSSIDKSSIAKLVESHHSKLEDPILKRLHEVLTDADSLSAKEREPLNINDKDVIFKTPLRSIFYEVKLSDSNIREEKYYNVVPLKNFKEDMILPKLRNKLPETFAENYACMWNNFKEEFNQLSGIKTLEGHFLTLYSLLLKYTFFIPSAAYQAEPTITLFDHSSTTCAIAESIYRSGDGRTLMLVGGDVCNIQSFIYTIISENAARMLRGRSFLIYLINILAARHIMNCLKILDPCLIFCGGGNFTILAPWSMELEEKLNNSIKEIDEWLLEELKGEIYVAINYIKIDKDELSSPQGYSECLRKLQERIEEAKLKQFNRILEDGYEKILEGKEEGHQKVCGVCKAILSKSELGNKIDETDVCSLCKKIEEIGNKLINANYLIIAFFKEDGLPNNDLFTISFKMINTGVKLCINDNDLFAFIKGLGNSNAKSLLKHLHVIKLNSGESFITKELIMETTKYGLPASFSFIPMANYVAKENGKVLSFDTIAEKGDGADYLAVAKMDVDNLGKILHYGLKPTISRFSTLSRLLSFFFEGYINQFIESRENLKNSLYVVYSGGDDLFIVGRWNAVCNFAQEFEADFKKLACNNFDVTISSGIALAEPKYPVHRMWLLAKNYIDRSKDRGKNRVTIFNEGEDYTVEWGTLSNLRDIKDNLVDKIKNRKIARGFLYTIRKVHEIYKYDGTGGGHSRAITRLKYIIGRKASESSDQELKKWWYEIENIISRFLPYIEIPIIWAELETRKEKGKRSGKFE